MIITGCSSQTPVPQFISVAATCPIPPSASSWAMHEPSNSLQLLDQLFFQSEPGSLPT
ncbi:MAG: lysis system o-spanin lipoprotein Rz1 [Pseudomonas sp.]